MNALAQFVGFRFFERDSRGRFELRFRWAEISGGLGLALGLMWYGDDDNDCSLHIRLGWPNIFLKLKLPRPYPREFGEFGPNYGFSVFGRAIHLNWGNACKILHFPWDWQWVRTSYLLSDGTWFHERKGDRKGRAYEQYQEVRTLRDARAWREVHPYRYVLRSGTIQERTATIEVSEAEHRWRWFTWLPFGRVSKGIDIKFNDEIGERSGSWKGGTLGCSYSMQRGESPIACLRRMEAERKF